MASTEQDGKYCDDDAKKKCQQVISISTERLGRTVTSKDMDALGYCLNLEREQRQQCDAHSNGHRRPDPRAAKTERQDVCQRSELIDPAQSQQRHQQYEGQYKH